MDMVKRKRRYNCRYYRICGRIFFTVFGEAALANQIKFGLFVGCMPAVKAAGKVK
ncbi:MAG: hypothetical protein GXW85_12465 [Clostridia bacterium]|nr:hypothetical protein [Clostridia bacterium]